MRQARPSEHGQVRDVAILPGLVNAHAHLQLDVLPRAKREFLPWLGAVMTARAGQKPADFRRLAIQSLRELLHSGTTAVGEIDSTGQTAAALRTVPMAGRLYRELTGFHLQGAEARRHASSHMPSASTATSMRLGLSPHAPYSVSPDLMCAAAQRTRSLAVHCAEVPEEQDFLRDGTGPFAALLAQLGKLPADFVAPGCGAVRWLERLGVLRPGTQLVHCQELERGDQARIAASGAAITVCPGTIEYFRRTPPPVAKWLRAGIPVALGTDSRASNRGLSMRRELRLAGQLWPELRPQQLLAMATTSGGIALHGPFGGLRRGRRADFLTVPASPSWQETLTAFVQGQAPTDSVVLAGVRHRPPSRR